VRIFLLAAAGTDPMRKMEETIVSVSDC